MSVSEEAKKAAVARIARLAPEGTGRARHVRAEAASLRVDVRTIYRWLAEDAIQPPQPTAFEITTEHLTVLANTQNRLAAYRALRTADEIDVSYATFCRGLNKVSPARLQGALQGRPGVVDNRLYLRHVSSYNNEVWHLDHTPADVRCYHPTRNMVIRPHLTVITDACSGLVHAFLLADRPNKETTVAALGEVATQHQIDGVTVTGLPDRLRLDNGGENLNSVMEAGAEALGIVIDPTMPYNSWQNGKAERAVQEVNRRLCQATPGGLHHGTDDKGGRRWTESLSQDVEPGSVLTFSRLNQMLADVVLELNRDVPMERLGGRTRLQAYADDPTERQPVSAELLRSALMTAPKPTYRCSKQGIQFERTNYVCADMQFGRAYVIRHWPNRRDYVEVYEADGRTYVGRAHSLVQMPTSESRRLLAERSWVEREQRAIAAGVEQHRALAAAAEWQDEEAESGQPIPRPRPKKARRTTSTQTTAISAGTLAFLEDTVARTETEDRA